MINEITPIVQELNHGLIEQYNELEIDYNKLKSKVENVYKDGITDIEFKDKLVNKVDNIAIDEEHSKEFNEYNFNKSKSIKKIFKNSYELDEEKISKLLRVRKMMIRDNLENTDLNKIGTSLNFLRDFHHDIYMDIERNKATWIELKSKQTCELLRIILPDEPDQRHQKINRHINFTISFKESNK